MLEQSDVGVRRYQDLAAWQLSRELERSVFAFTTISPAATDLDYCRQIRRSSSSAARNVAEGFGRYLPAEFARFLRIAVGSLRETRDHLDAGLERRFLSASLHRELVALTDRAIGASVRLIKYLDQCKDPPGGRRGRSRRK